ncbi:MAG TPA: helix-turn-helix domain-containing protein [Protaetiibacter sp.]|nr:helix-turn-helix domain-containing protein [Protaetiibacter sp.]
MTITAASRTRRPRRRDAQERYDRILATAQREFAARGVDASLEGIAREAGVAIGTLYRHFPTRLDLLLAALEPRLAELLDESERVMAIDDPWTAFASYLENLFRLQAGDRGFNDFLSRRFPGSAETERLHDQICEHIDEVLIRAQDAGVVRLDITRGDIVTLIWSSSRMIDATSVTAPSAWRRQLALMLDAYRAPRAHPLPEPPLTDEQLYDAMVRLNAAD